MVDAAVDPPAWPRSSLDIGEHPEHVGHTRTCTAGCRRQRRRQPRGRDGRRRAFVLDQRREPLRPAGLGPPRNRARWVVRRAMRQPSAPRSRSQRGCVRCGTGRSRRLPVVDARVPHRVSPVSRVDARPSAGPMVSAADRRADGLVTAVEDHRLDVGAALHQPAVDVERRLLGEHLAGARCVTPEFRPEPPCSSGGPGQRHLVLPAPAPITAGDFERSSRPTNPSLRHPPVRRLGASGFELLDVVRGRAVTEVDVHHRRPDVAPARPAAPVAVSGSPTGRATCPTGSDDLERREIGRRLTSRPTPRCCAPGRASWPRRRSGARTAPSRRRARPRAAATACVRPPIHSGTVCCTPHGSTMHPVVVVVLAVVLGLAPATEAGPQRAQDSSPRAPRSSKAHRAARTPAAACRHRRRGSAGRRDAVERAVALGDRQRVVVAEHEHVGREADARGDAPRGTRRWRAGPSTGRRAPRRRRPG